MSRADPLSGAYPSSVITCAHAVAPEMHRASSGIGPPAGAAEMAVVDPQQVAPCLSRRPARPLSPPPPLPAERRASTRCRRRLSGVHPGSASIASGSGGWSGGPGRSDRLSWSVCGVWRSLVARPSGGRKVAGSSPVTPTRERLSRGCEGRSVVSGPARRRVRRHVPGRGTQPDTSRGSSADVQRPAPVMPAAAGGPARGRDRCLAGASACSETWASTGTWTESSRSADLGQPA